ncbi:MAG: cupin domain-containing protein [Alphaproteobacteria bacterium]
MDEALKLNADLTARAVVRSAEMDWQASPSPTVWRKRLYLDGPAEAGMVTSVVHYDPGSEFPTHHHPDGEEIFVLDGVFSDEHGDYPAGTYLLNPDGTSHAPFSKEGCTLFVKLRQYRGDDRTPVEMNTNALDWQPRTDSGVWQKPLYRQGGHREWTQLLKLESGAEAPHHGHPNGEEVFVIDGEFEDEFGTYPAGTWTRSPPRSAHTVKSPKGAILYVRFGGMEA